MKHAMDGSHALIPYSGGVESMCLVAYARENNANPNLLVFKDNHTEYANRRAAMTAGIIQLGLLWATTTVNMPDNDRLQWPNGYIPGYKLSMVITAMAHAERLQLPFVLFGHCRENSHQGYPDQSYTFFEETSALYNKYYGKSPDRIAVHNPLFGFTKSELIRKYHRDVPLELSVSCDSLVHTGVQHCGKCQGCTDRFVAFDLAGVADPTDYQYPPNPSNRTAP